MADWTVEEARAYLPRLRLILEMLRRSVQVSARARSNGHGGPLDTDHDEGRGDEAETVADLDPADALAEEGLTGLGPTEALAELEERGIVLRDLERGLVDFPSRHPGGREVLLCWQLGEPDLAWWHLPEDGFAGRRPLPLPPHI
jgi:uncharacterized protein DUF2203